SVPGIARAPREPVVSAEQNWRSNWHWSESAEVRTSSDSVPPVFDDRSSRVSELPPESRDVNQRVTIDVQSASDPSRPIIEPNPSLYPVVAREDATEPSQQSCSIDSTLAEAGATPPDPTKLPGFGHGIKPLGQIRD